MTKNYVMHGKKTVHIIIILKLTCRKGPHVCCKYYEAWGRIHERSQVSNLRFFLDFSQI